MSSSSGDGAAPHVVEDCCGVVSVYSDGTIVRSSSPHTLLSVPVREEAFPVEWKDLPFFSSSSSQSYQIRLYRPHDTKTYTGSKLPVVLYFHGGGFCIGSLSWPVFHKAGLRLASDLHALIIAPDYRLAPEHRLPAAIDDASAALAWLRSHAASTSPDPWIAESADFSRVFVSGDSAGANLAHQLAFRSKSPDLYPLRVRGYVLLMPFFGGIQRTRSEADCPKDASLNMELSDMLWRLALPLGATRDHALANPLGPENPRRRLEGLEVEAMLVVVGGKDPLRDRNVEYAEMLRELGKPVEMVEFEGQQHGFFPMDSDSEAATELVRVFRRFVEEKGQASSST